MGFVQANGQLATGTFNTAFNSPNGSGNFLCCAVNSVVSPSISDTNGNTWTKVVPTFQWNNTSGYLFTDFYICAFCKPGSNSIHVSGPAGCAVAFAEYTNVGIFDTHKTSALNASSATTMTSGAAPVHFSNELVIGVYMANSALVTGLTDGSSLRSPSHFSAGNNVCCLSDQVLGPAGNYTASGTIGNTSGSVFFAGFYSFQQAPPTNGTVLGVYTGTSLHNAFPSNPLGLDILQVVDEGGQVVWNLTAAGVTNINPANPTIIGGNPEALLYQLFGSTLPVATGPQNRLDLIQVIGQGNTVNFWVDYQGNAHGTA